MKNKLAVLFLWVYLGITPASFAQADMEQAKLDIWTETADFVYRDANLPNAGQFNNVTSMTEFVALIKKEDANSAIYSKLYKPIEDGGFYKQPKAAKAQLNTLVKSIYARLRTNDQRMNDINRRRKLDDLNKQLQQIAADYGVPAATGAPIVQDVDLQSPDSAQENETFTDPDGTDTDATAEEKLSSLAKREESTISTENNSMTILALALGLINLVLIFLLNKEIKKQSKRIDQRRVDIDNLAQMVNLPGRTTEGGGKITLAAVENLISRAIAKERESGQATAGGGASVPQRPIKMAAGNPAPVAVPVAPATAPVSAKPLIVDDSPSLEELVTPVSATPPPVAPPSDKPQSKYARIPVNGGFHEQDLYEAPQHDSIYEIRISRKDPNRAMFRIVTNSSVHRSAIESAYLSLKDACTYQMNNTNATRIVNDEPGVLNHVNGFWKIDRKAHIHFE
ncbi:hypothetical protein [Adhaeribacter pallidiroseus]|uniref:Uncharacterized protein n=1 Tax=Adhaeribacter pallidiroseus TaxID=2072847 RepID=A0A369QM23_9BACT|nr:hypothetical protein [Adhaeribacter pallidiroseus]RDC65981.1 hypothetical protein AHMF7616_04612 [Adhaeribacter pallidiroseus]